MDDSDRIAVALMVLAKTQVVDAEAVSAALLPHWPAWVVARAVTRSLGLACDADAACALAAEVSSARVESVRQLLREQGMSDLLGEPTL
jgi:hypothetical protein